MLDQENATDPAQDAFDRVKPKFRRNDHVSPIAIIFLVVFWFMQSSFADRIPALLPHKHSLVKSATSGPQSAAGDEPSDATVQAILQIDTQAKASYISTGVSPAKSASSPFAAILSQSMTGQRTTALNTAVKLLEQNHDQPAIARRVILLRAENGDPNPLGPLPGKIPFSPLDSYTLVAAASPAARTTYAPEVTVWTELYANTAKISPAQAASLTATIESIARLRWWGKIAEHQIYVRSGQTALANSALTAVQREASESVVGSTFVGLGALLAFLLGIVGIILLIVHKTSGQATQSGQPGAATELGIGSIFDADRPLVTDEDRRLGAGDLLNVFVLYLILMMTVGLIASPILESAFGKGFSRVPDADRMLFTIGAEAIATGACGLITLLALFGLAKLRGARVSDEIGLNNGRNVARMIGFGLLGWCISLPLLLAFASLSKVVFHTAPQPANPAIPLLLSTPPGLASVILYILVAVIAPFFEETMFRGIFYNAARLRLGVPMGILATGLAFGLSHQVGIADQIPLAVLGGVFAWMAETRKSLLPSMFAHCLQNSFVYATLLFTLLTIPA